MIDDLINRNQAKGLERQQRSVLPAHPSTTRDDVNNRHSVLASFTILHYFKPTKYYAMHNTLIRHRFVGNYSNETNLTNDVSGNGNCYHR